MKKSQSEYFYEYINELMTMDFPSKIVIQNYKMSDAQRRCAIKCYSNELYRGKKPSTIQLQKLSKIRKAKIEPINLCFLTPMIHIAKNSAAEFSMDVSACFLAEKIIAHKMSEDFKDNSIEDSVMWYNLYRFRALLKHENDVIDTHSLIQNQVLGYALANQIYHKYEIDPDGVTKNIRSFATKKTFLNDLIAGYSVKLDENMIKDLKTQSKLLIKKYK